MSRLKAIRPFGQRVWLDNLSRQLLASGELQTWLEEDGIAGVTSNPAIFHKSISQDARYQEDLKKLLLDKDLSAEQRYESLVLDDIRQTCDALSSLYEQSKGDEGYVSLEVSPQLAHDSEGTYLAGMRLWSAINRPNAMIKVPATKAGALAFEKLIAQGINVNITLLFSLEQVNLVWDHYIKGLQSRADLNLPLENIRAVASFFLSRIDSALDAKVDPSVQGKVAISLAKEAYQQYLQRFHSESFASLKALGAKPQYLLWASTGTKNTNYSDVLYVESLIGDETINTVPDATLLAFKDHGTAQASLGQNVEQAKAVLMNCEAQGIDFQLLGEDLQKQGLKMFDDAFDALLQLTKA